MSLLNNKIEYIKKIKYDELYTPEIAVECILDFIPNNIKNIWEPTAIKNSNIVKVLTENGYNVITSHINDGLDFLNYEPDQYDLIITNPPYSIKDDFLQRAFELNKPFMFLLPITALEGNRRGKMFNNNKIQLIIPNKRFNFKPEKNGSWFQTSWFCYGLNLNDDLNFIKIN